MNLLIFFGICSTPKLSKYVAFSEFTYNSIQLVPIDFTHQDLLHMPHPLL